MNFASAGWLWGLLFLPFFYFYVLWDEQKKQKEFLQFADRSFWSLLVPQMDLTYPLRKARFGLVAFGLLLIALARPQFGFHEEGVHLLGSDMMIVLDVSRSMDVEDVVPSRLKKAKHFLKTLLSHLGGDRVGVIAFAGSAFVACPLTTDLSYVADTLDILDPSSVQNQGTDIGAALLTGLKALERGAEEIPHVQAQTPPSYAMILISDGEDHEGQSLKIAEQLREKQVKLYVLGVGTEKGGPIPLKGNSGGYSGYKRNRKGDAILSYFHSDQLQKVAEAAHGNYWSLSSTEDEVHEVLKSLGALNQTDYMEKKFRVYHERYQIPLALALLFFFLEISIATRKKKGLGKEGSALLMMSALFCSLLGIPKGAQALEEREPRADRFSIRPPAWHQADSWDAYQENQKGIQSLQQGQAEEAQKHFGAAQAHSPIKPELEFNQGVAQFQQGQFDRAIQNFENSADMAKQQNNEALLGKSFYNLGNALAQKGEVRQAAQAYLETIRSAQKQKNDLLEYQARKNLELLQSESQKKQSDQQKPNEQPTDQKDKENKEPLTHPGQKEDSKQDKKQSSQATGDPSSDPQEEKKEEKNKTQPNQDLSSSEKDRNSHTEKSKKQDKSQLNQEKEEETKKRDSHPSPEESSTPSQRQKNFKSEKMQKEDADRVISELKNRERQLRESLQAENSAHQEKAQSGKDW